MKLLLDEMYPATLAEALRAHGIQAFTASELGVAGRSDQDLFAAAAADAFLLLTENVADFARIAGEHLTAGGHHPGVLIALSTRFSRRPSGIRAAMATAVLAVSEQDSRPTRLPRPTVLITRRDRATPEHPGWRPRAA